MKHILSLISEEVEKILLQLGEKKYRINQILSWIYDKYCINFEEMTNISKSLREN